MIEVYAKLEENSRENFAVESRLLILLVHHQQDVNVECEINPPPVSPSEILGKAGTKQSILLVHAPQNPFEVI